MGKTADYPIRSKPGEPVWEMATFYPRQGQWTVDDYLAIETNRLIEYDHGVLEFLTMPTRTHQQIVWYLIQLLKSVVVPSGGEAFFAPIRMRIAEEIVREPDLMAFLRKDDPRAADKYFTGADLLMEVVSEGAEDRKRDYIDKRKEYEAAGITEYWIVDPHERKVTILALRDGKYVEHSVVKDGQTAQSALLPGMKTEVSNIFNVD
jgi:Uma2 family endonuclease